MKTLSYYLKSLLVVLLTLTLLTSCDKNKNQVEDDCNISTFFKELDTPNQPTEIDTPELIGESEEVLPDGIVCIVRDYKYAPGFEESLLLDPTSTVLYPGSMLHAGSVISGEYSTITAKRTPITLSKSGTGNSVEVIEPELNKVREAIYELTRNTTVQEAQIVADVTQIYSEEHLRLAIKGNFKSMLSKIEAKFDWNKSEINSRFLIQFHQVYYSIDVNPKSGPEDWFTNKNPNICENINHMPMYVSSVKYGRVGMLMLESIKSASEVEAALSTTFGNDTTGVGIDINGEYSEIWNASTFKLLLVGGNPDDGVKAVNSINGFNNWITNGGNYTESSPGSPIAYTLRFIDGPVAKVVKTGEYSVRECTTGPVNQEVSISIMEGDSIVVCPTHIAGDREFQGNGPVQKAKARLFIKNQDELWLELFYNVKETEADWTEGTYSDHFKVWKAGENNDYHGYHITEIITPNEFGTPDGGILDEDGSLDFWPEDVVNLDNFVKRFSMMGDTGGDDLPETPGACNPEDFSYLRIDFNLVQLQLKVN